MNWMQVVLSLLVLASSFSGTRSECRMEDEQCEFWLEITHKLTMMYSSMKYAVYPYKGRLYKYDVPEDQTNVTDPVNPDNIIIADGWEEQKLVVVANNSMPGPPIEVYENQTVVVHVTNLMTAAAVTIHWHGLHQTDTPWMDGVALITQCPIEPGQTFTYRFKAYPKGTFWYHSHIGAQLGMGLVGAFIIREKEASPMAEHIMVLQDWNHNWDADVAHLRMEYGSFSMRQKLPTTDSLELGHFSNYQFQSGLINGRGRYLEINASSNETPLTEFYVEQGTSYRFRVIGAGNLYPFRVSVDGHMLTLIASDGFDLEEVVLESFVINPGERYDFVLHANQATDNYWIRAETLEVNVVNHIALAILRYNGSSMEEPTTERKQCSTNDRCQVANCPYSYYPVGHYTDCHTFDDLKARENHRTPGYTTGLDEEIEDLFLNFGFPGNTSYPSTVNGRKFKKPPSPALTQPMEVPTYCKAEDNCGDQKTCHCTYSLSLKHGKVYQIIMSNLGKGKGWAHPIHLHGHSFHVVKMGYPPYNETTGHLLGDSVKQDNSDITCPGSSDPAESFCNSPRWTNSSWGGNNIPGLELERPPIKDTLIIPTGGYAIMRIRADNPGAWLLHCHIELHNLDGMSMMFNESYEHQKAPPPDFPKCGSFQYDKMEEDPESGTPTVTSVPTASPRPISNDDDDDCMDNDVFWAVVGCLIAACIIQMCIIVWLWQDNRKTNSKKSFSPNGRTAHDKDVNYDNAAFTS